MMRSGPIALLLFALSPLALTWPEGAPPGQVEHDGGEHCGQCHYAASPPSETNSFTASDLPKQVAAGEELKFVLRLIGPKSRVGRFQLTLVDTGGGSGELLPS